MSLNFSKLAATAAMTMALIAPAIAQAKPITLIAKLTNYRYSPADLVIYVTDSKGVYQGSLWMAGTNPRYYRHLIHWMRATRGNLREISGITGASVGSGQTLKVQLDVSAALFDAGYMLHIDAAVENMRESPSDVVVPLTTKGSGKAVKGKNFIASFKYNL